MTAALNLVGLLANIALKLTEMAARLLLWIISGVTRWISGAGHARRAYPDRRPTVIRKPPRKKRGRTWRKRKR